MLFAVFYFTRSGGLFLNFRSLRHIGNGGNAWTNTTTTDKNNTFFFNLGADTLHVSHYHARYMGAQFRCLASRP